MSAPSHTTQLYYGRVCVTHYDQDVTREIGTVINQALKDAGLSARVDVEWMLHRDGTDIIDARWNGKAWIDNPVKKKR